MNAGVQQRGRAASASRGGERSVDIYIYRKRRGGGRGVALYRGMRLLRAVTHTLGGRG
jgi:hypothetical protein